MQSLEQRANHKSVEPLELRPMSKCSGLCARAEPAIFHKIGLKYGFLLTEQLRISCWLGQLPRTTARWSNSSRKPWFRDSERKDKAQQTLPGLVCSRTLSIPHQRCQVSIARKTVFLETSLFTCSFPHKFVHFATRFFKVCLKSTVCTTYWKNMFFHLPEKCEDVTQAGVVSHLIDTTSPVILVPVFGQCFERRSALGLSSSDMEPFFGCRVGCGIGKRTFEMVLHPSKDCSEEKGF